MNCVTNIPAFRFIRRSFARQNAENKQTLDLTRKIEINEKTCQNAENKVQTCDLTRKIFAKVEIEVISINT